MILLINEELGARFPLVSSAELMLMSFNEIDLLVIDGSVIIENTSNDMFAKRFRTKHSFLIFGVWETLYYLND